MQFILLIAVISNYFIYNLNNIINIVSLFNLIALFIYLFINNILLIFFS
jgi:hypothetical protein